MNQIKKPANLSELTDLVKSFGPRKVFKPGDVVVCVQRPFGQRSPVPGPGDRAVVVEHRQFTTTFDGSGLPAGEIADHVCARLEPDHPQGFITGALHSSFFVLESEYVEPAAPETAPSEEN